MTPPNTKTSFGDLPSPRFLLIDGMAMVFRGFFAIPTLTNSQGKNTNAVYGFYLILFNLLKQIKPTHVSICFDRKEKTKRKEEFSDYKATRKPAPNELIEQIPYIKAGIREMNLNLLEKAGYEADDLIATIAEENHKKDIYSIIYTGDLDLLQLANHCVKILTPHNQKQGILMGREEVIAKYGFTPEQIPDYKGLHGDPSDNLPGVKGVGKKTATKLLNEYQTLEGIYDHLDELTPKMREKFEEHKDISFLCKKLATLHTDLEYEIPETNFDITDFNYEAAEAYLNNYELNSLHKKLADLNRNLPQKEDPAQLALFG